MSDTDEGPLFDEVQTPAADSEPSSLPADSMETENEKQEESKKADRDQDTLPASLPVKSDPEPVASGESKTV
eukprot:Seg13751.1 transcript_id=Seg13751.1/GoldUCD/mRNA.D3Y31 product="hypothetical protein" protein_id=Seg13751.1/GoldUCD/D3Y31